MPSFGSATPGGVPVQYTISYDGTTRDWGSSRLFSLGEYSINANSLDNTYQLSGLSCQLIDTDGAVWSALGSGTNCLRKPFTLVAHVGGTTTNTTAFDGVRVPYTFGTQGAFTATVFTGRLAEVSRSKRVVKMRGESALRQLSDMKWQPPVNKNPLGFTRYGSFYFHNTIEPEGLNRFNLSGDGQEFECVAYDTGSFFSGEIQTIYLPLTSRTVGTDWFGTFNVIPGTQFYFDHPRVAFKGTYLGTYFGTVTSLEFARALGYPSQTAAEADIVRSSQGTYYPRDLYRLTHKGTTTVGTWMYFEGTFRLQGGPGTLFEWLTTSRIVEPFFGGTDINSNVLSFTNQVVPTYYFDRTFLPGESDPFEALKDLFQSTQALFSLNGNNQFEFRAYGPVDLSATPGTILQADLTDSSITNSAEDYVNRVVFRYDYNLEDDKFYKDLELKGSTWTRETDTPKEIESKWVHNSVEAEGIAAKVLSRYQFTRPKVNLSGPLKLLEYGVGTVLSINDPDSFGTGKLAVLTGVAYDFDNFQVTLEAEDGDALYRQRGYARFDSIGGTVTGTSKSGFSASGTVHNINTVKYGSVFRWF